MLNMKALPAGCLLALLASMPGQAQELADEVFNCVMDPAQVIEVGSPVSGLLDLVEVARGDQVTRGQLIARVNSNIERATVELLRTRATSTAAIEAQKARVNSLNMRYKRTKSLRQRNVVAEQAMEDVTAELIASRSLLKLARLEHEVAKKELARAEEVLGLREIRSPIDGIVAERRLSAGEYIDQDSHVVRLVRLDPLYVETFLPVHHYASLKVGATGWVKPAPPMTGEFEATVLVVDRVFDAASGTFGVRLELANPGSALAAGHRCKLRFEQTGDG